MCSNFGGFKCRPPQTRGGIYLKRPKYEHIFVAVITFPPFFCADTFDNNLLLIVCAKMICKMSLWAPFLRRSSKKARVTQILHLPNLGKGNSKVPWSTGAQIGLWLAKTRSCDVVVSIILLLKHCWVMVIRKVTSQILRGFLGGWKWITL